METIDIATTRYSAVFRRILETYSQDVEVKIDGRAFGPDDVPDLLTSWCTNRRLVGTRNFALSRSGRVLFSFHDHPSELFAAESERAFVDQLVAAKLARQHGLRSSQEGRGPNAAGRLAPVARLRRLLRSVASR